MSDVDLFPNYEADADGFYVHKGCGAPIIGTSWRMGCIKCSPDLINLDPRILAWIKKDLAEKIATRIEEFREKVEWDSPGLLNEEAINALLDAARIAREVGSE